ncbi:hypothetical protein BOX15_Mlig014593g1, partial [Macrostomum lignano]
EFVPHPSPSGSLMHEIQRLVATPGSGSDIAASGAVESSNQQPAQQHHQQQHQQQLLAQHHRYYSGDWKAPRAVNHVECDSCGADGDLLCCDRCPASFHPECLNPPLEKEAAPTHDWYCHECSLRLLNAGDSSNKADSESLDSPGGCLLALATAVQAANPREFAPPVACGADATGGLLIPGLAERTNCGAARTIELELGAFVPQPVRRCYVCGGNCRRAPLLPCDYCSLCYHLDCLDPPLTVPPSRWDLWMCPAHPEHLIDRFLLSSSRLSERARLWNRLAKKPVSVQEVLHNFCSKRRLWRRLQQRRFSGRLRRRQLPPPAVATDVPAAIKAAYRCPASPPTPPRSPPRASSAKPPRAKATTGQRTELERCAAAALEQLQSGKQQVASAPGQTPCFAYLVRYYDSSDTTSSMSVYRLTNQVVSVGLLDSNILSLASLWNIDCSLIDPEQHAVICCSADDDGNSSFELLNYSQYGTVVDGVVYGVDADASRSSREPVLSHLVQTVDDFLNRNDDDSDSLNSSLSDSEAKPDVKRSLNKSTSKQSLSPSPRRMLRCRCGFEPLEALAGWEGSAVLRHGSVIRMGCLSMLFVLPLV